MNRDDLLYQADLGDIVQQMALICDIRASGVEPEPQELARLKACLDRVGRRAVRYHLAKLMQPMVDIALAEDAGVEVTFHQTEAYVSVRDKVMTK